jgi:hypothetical protein
MTLDQLVAAIGGASGVGLAFEDGDPVPVHVPNEGTTLHRATVRFYVAADGVGRLQKVDVWVVDYGKGTEAAAWADRIPEPLRPVPDPPEFITDRAAGSFSESQVEGFANDAWRELVHVDARDIRDFSATAVDGSTVEVSGWFHLSSNAWHRKRYDIHLIDPDGNLDITTTAGQANIEFQEKVSAEGVAV